MVDQSPPSRSLGDGATISLACTPASRVGAAGAETPVNLARHIRQRREAIMDKPMLRLLIQERLADGRLPHDDIPRVWGGPGTGEPCHGCGEPVTSAQNMIGGLDARVSGIRLHSACFYLWEVERSDPARRRWRLASEKASSPHAPDALRPGPRVNHDLNLYPE